MKLHIMLKSLTESKRSKLYLYDITIDEQYAYYHVDVILSTILIKELRVQMSTFFSILKKNVLVTSGNDKI